MKVNFSNTQTKKNTYWNDLEVGTVYRNISQRSKGAVYLKLSDFECYEIATGKIWNKPAHYSPLEVVPHEFNFGKPELEVGKVYIIHAIVDKNNPHVQNLGWAVIAKRDEKLLMFDANLFRGVKESVAIIPVEEFLQAYPRAIFVPLSSEISLDVEKPEIYK